MNCGRLFSSSPKADAIQWGGGVIAEFVRGLQKPTRFSGGGGGGVVAEFFRGLQNPGIFRYWSPFTFWVFQKGGGPPPESATEL